VNGSRAAAATCGLVELGLTPYDEALAVQRRLGTLRAEGRVGDLLLLLEHPPVITLGRGGNPAHVLASRATLASRRIELFNVERGGDVTYHGPGQLVGYPILDLAERGRDLHAYLHRLEEVLIETLAAFGLEAGRLTGRTGVWVRSGKIASIGIHVSRWVTRHGFSLNVDLDLGPFELIVPCGIVGARATSMAEQLASPVKVDRVVRVMSRRFEASFGVELLPMSLAAILASADSIRRCTPLIVPSNDAAGLAAAAASSLR
jgi:lipoic acid synthetase